MTWLTLKECQAHYYGALDNISNERRLNSDLAQMLSQAAFRTFINVTPLTNNKALLKEEQFRG
jgi:hypothetical protein